MQLTNIGKQAFTLASSISSSVASGACYGARGVAKLGSATVSVITKSVSFIGSSIVKIGSVALGALKSISNGFVCGAKHIPKNKYTLLAVGAAAATAIYAKKFFKKEAKVAEEKPEAEKAEVAQANADAAVVVADADQEVTAEEKEASEHDQLEATKTVSLHSSDEEVSIHSDQAANDA